MTGGVGRARGAVRPWQWLALLLLPACTSLPSIPSLPSAASPDWPSRRAALQGQADFTLKGRVAVAAGEEGFTAGLRWRQRAGDALIELDGPFGVGGLRLEARGEALQLTTSRGEHLDGEAARAELERQLGFDLPLASLRYWVRGVPDPARPAQERLAADAPRLSGLAQDGWDIDYGAYLEQPATGALPRRVSAVRERARLRLVIEDWSAGNGP